VVAPASAAPAVARQYLTALAEGHRARARRLAVPAGAAASQRLADLGGSLQAIPIAKAAADA